MDALSTFEVNDVIAREFFDNEELFQASRVDGYTKEDMVRILADPDNEFVATAIGDKVIAVTSIEPYGMGLMADVHTFVLPEYRKHATEALTEHMDWMYYSGISRIYTTCSQHNKKVVNFLTKRLGFSVYDSFETKAKRDGDSLVVIKLQKVLADEIFPTK